MYSAVGPGDGAPAHGHDPRPDHQDERRLCRVAPSAGAAGNRTGDAPQFLFWTLATLTPPAHLFAQLRGAYQSSIFSAAWRTTALLGGAGLILVLFVIGVIALQVAH